MNLLLDVVTKAHLKLQISDYVISIKCSRSSISRTVECIIWQQMMCNFDALIKIILTLTDFYSVLKFTYLKNFMK